MYRKVMSHEASFQNNKVASQAQTMPDRSNLAQQLDQPETDSLAFYILGTLLALIAAFVLYDRRQGYIYLLTFQETLRRWRIFIRNYYLQLKMKKKGLVQKVDGEDLQPSSKAFGVIESEKTFVDSDTDRQSRQETAASPSQPEDYPSMGVEEETPNIDLKEVFVTDKRKGKESHRSKSKLRGRVTIKKSELEAEGAEEEASCDFSQDLQISGVEDEANEV